MTDAEWAERRLRSERRFRFVFGGVFGLVVGLYAVWHWGFLANRYQLADALIVGGSMVLFATLFTRRRDEQALGLAAWISFTEWKAAASLPWWVIAASAATLFVVVFLLGVVLVVGRLPF
jgi:hypothetical protein